MGSARSGTVLSAGVVVIRNDASAPSLLMLRAYRNWDFPKGLVESDETPFDAALREVREETTLDDLAFHWGRAYFETPPYNRGKVARYYIAQSAGENVSLPINPELGRAEHHEYRWVGFDEAFRLATPRVQEVLDWARAVITAGANEVAHEP